MNFWENPGSVSQFILENFQAERPDRHTRFEPGPWRDHPTHHQRTEGVEPEFQAWLRYKNANGSDIDIGMNPLVLPIA
jgi:hypothetical protein